MPNFPDIPVIPWHSRILSVFELPECLVHIVIRIQRVNVPILLFIPFTQLTCLTCSNFRCNKNTLFHMSNKWRHSKKSKLADRHTQLPLKYCVNGINSKMGTLTLWMRITMCTR